MVMIYTLLVHEEHYGLALAFLVLHQNHQQRKSSLEPSCLLSMTLWPHLFEAVSVLSRDPSCTYCTHCFCCDRDTHWGFVYVLWQLLGQVPAWLCISDCDYGSAASDAACWSWTLYQTRCFHLSCPSASRSPVLPPSVASLRVPRGPCFLECLGPGCLPEHVSPM